MPAPEELCRFNGIVSSVYAMDNVLRLLSYGSDLIVETTRSPKHPMTNTQLFLLELKARLSDARFVNRMFGFPATLEGFAAWDDDNQPHDLFSLESLHSFISKGKTMSMLIYYPMEHIYWLSSFKNSIFSSANTGWFSKLSCQAWLFYVFCDFLGTLVNIVRTQYQLMSNEIDGASRKKITSELRKMIVWMTCIMSDMVLALQFSVDKPPFSPETVRYAGLWGGAIGLYYKWICAAPKLKSN